MLLRSGVAFCPSIDYLERAWQDAVRGRPSEAPYLEVEVPTTIDDTLTDDGATVVTMFTQYGPYNEEGWPEGSRERYGQQCLDTLGAVAPNVKDAVVAPRGARAAGPRAHLRAARRQHLPGRAGPGPDGVHAPDAGAGAVRDAGRRAVPVRRGHAPGRRGHGRRRAQRGQADPAATSAGRSCGGRCRRATAMRRPRSRYDDARPRARSRPSSRRARGASSRRCCSRSRRRPSAGETHRRGRRAHQVRGDGRGARTAGCTRASTAGRAGRSSSGCWSRSSSGARPTPCRGTSRPPTTCSRSGSPEQIDRWLRPSLRGEGHDAYAVTEEHAGSDPSGIATTARAARRRLGDRRREVVRHLRRHRDRLHRRGERGGRGADAVPGRRDAAGHLDRRRPAVHAHLSARAPDDPLRRASRCATTTSSAGSARATSCSARGSPRSGSGSPRAAWGRCGGCSTRRPRGR